MIDDRYSDIISFLIQNENIVNIHILILFHVLSTPGWTHKLSSIRKRTQSFSDCCSNTHIVLIIIV